MIDKGLGEPTELVQLERLTEHGSVLHALQMSAADEAADSNLGPRR